MAGEQKRGNVETKNGVHIGSGEANKTPKNSPGVTDHPVPRVLILNVALQAFVKPHHCTPVPQGASETEVRKCIRSQA